MANESYLDFDTPSKPKDTDSLGLNFNPRGSDKQEHKLYSKSITRNEHTIYFTELENHPDLSMLLNTLRNSGDDDTLTIRIDSFGGYVSELYKIKSVIQEKFYGKTTTILDPSGASAAAIIFTFGDKRIAYEHSWIMFHDWSGGAVGKASDVVSRVKFYKQLYDNIAKSELKEFLTKEELNDMLNGKEFWFDIKKLCKRGIATHVRYAGKEVTAEEYLKYLKKNK